MHQCDGCVAYGRNKITNKKGKGVGKNHYQTFLKRGKQMGKYQIYTITYECPKCGYSAIHYRDFQTKIKFTNCPKCENKMTAIKKTYES